MLHHTQHSNSSSSSSSPSQWSAMPTTQQHYHHHNHHQQHPHRHQHPSSQPGPSSSAVSSTPTIVETPSVGSSNNNSSVLAARGRKRKRLQKACTACHRAKRRCDGGLPCSNCDFSGRLCCYGDNAAPPAKVARELATPTVVSASPQQPSIARAPSSAVPMPSSTFLHPSHANTSSNGASSSYSSHQTSSPFARQQQQLPALMTSPGVPTSSLPLPPSQVSMSSGFHVHHGHPSPSSSSAFKPIGTLSPPHSTVEALISPITFTAPSTLAIVMAAPSNSERKELISTFFNRVHPYSALFDEVTFLRELATGESPMQLWPMYALAARFISPSNTFHAGERYAQQTRKFFSSDDAPASDSTGLLDRAYIQYLDRPDASTLNHLLAVAQTVLLLSAYEFAVGRHQAAMSHSAACIRLLVGAGLHRPSALVVGAGTHSDFVRCRLVSIAFTHDVVLAALSDQSPTVRRFDFELAGLKGSSDSASTEHYRRSSSHGDHHLHMHPSSSSSSSHHRRLSDLARTSTERLTAQLDNLARAAGIFAHAFELRRQNSALLASGHGASISVNLSDEINRQLCEWSERLETAQTFNGDNVQRHGNSLWSVQDGSKEWNADHGVSLGWALMHTLSECSSVLAKSGGGGVSSSSLTESEHHNKAGLASARGNLILLLDNMHHAGRSSLVSLLPMLYAQQLGGSLSHAMMSSTTQQQQQVDAWLGTAFSLWSMSPIQRRKATMILLPAAAVGSGGYRSASASISSLSGGRIGRSLPPFGQSTSAPSTDNVLPPLSSARISPSPSMPANTNRAGTTTTVTRPMSLVGQKRSYSGTSVGSQSSTSPHLHSLAQLNTPPLSTTSPTAESTNNKAGGATTSPSTTSSVLPSSATTAVVDSLPSAASSPSSSSCSPTALSMSSSAASSSGGRSPPPPPPVLPLSKAGAAAVFKANTLPPLISFHKHRV
ncbi:hypothetical protein V8E36_003031 [Tilletia maclaganii]